MEQLFLLHNEKSQDVDEKNEEVQKRRQLLRNQFSQVRERRLDFEAKCRARMELCGNVNADGNDKIKLNVGGVRMSCKRSTLTLFPTSKLAMMFSGRWDKKLLRDKKGRIFLDADPLCFRFILDHLVVCLNAPADVVLPLPEVNESLKTTFDQLCLFFDIFPKHRPKFAEESLNSSGLVDEENDSDATGNVDNSFDSFGTLTDALNEEQKSLVSIEKALQKIESKYTEDEKFINFFAAGDTSDIVKLEIGGEVVAVRRSTLRLFEGSVLYCQFDDTAWRQGKRKHEGEGEHNMASDSDDDEDVVLIEQPAYVFGKLVNQLRLMAITPPAGKNAPLLSILSHEESNFKEVVQYYFPGQEHVIIPHTFSPSVLNSRPHALLVQGWVQEAMTDKTARLHLPLLYQASRDGFGTSFFHEKCDCESATVTLVKTTEGFVFGGYSDKSWNYDNSSRSTNGWKSSFRAFLFSIVNPSFLPVKLPFGAPKANMIEVQCHPYAGPCFGRGGRRGYYLRICDESNTRRESSTQLGTSYTLPDGSNKFLVAEIEVFAVRQAAAMNESK